MNTTTKPGALAVITAEIESILRAGGSPPVALMEARATVEQMAGALQRAVEAAEARMPNASFLSDARAALAAFRGES